MQDEEQKSNLVNAVSGRFCSPSDPLRCLHDGRRSSEPCLTPAAALAKCSCSDSREIILNSHWTKWEQIPGLQCTKPELKEKSVLWGLSKRVKHKGWLKNEDICLRICNGTYLTVSEHRLNPCFNWKRKHHPHSRGSAVLHQPNLFLFVSQVLLAEELLTVEVPTAPRTKESHPGQHLLPLNHAALIA